MPSAPQEVLLGQVTQLLRDAGAGDAGAYDRLFPLLYDELQRIARQQLRRERAGHTLQPTALVNEAYLKLAAQPPEWQGRAHFLAVAARAMRQVLVDYARYRAASKRGGGWKATTLAGKEIGTGIDFEQLIVLDEALAGLEERQRRVVECRFFGGMQEEEIAAALGVSVRTVHRDWTRARAWLYAALYPDDPAGA